jgi:uncharacterized protein
MYKIFFLTLVALWSACSNNNSSAYIEEIETYRAQIHVNMNSSRNSPFYEKKNFKGLDFFKPDETYAVQAKVIKQSEPELIQLETTTDRKPLYFRAYQLVFKINEKECTLWAYVKTDEENVLFIPFKDLTNNALTYGGGRYIEMDKPSDTSTTIVLDFNKAFNPYCHYNEKFSCPIVPTENNLEVEILAGEKIYPYK